MELVDTHCHIQSAGATTGEANTRELWAKAPDKTGDEMIAAAAEQGVTRLLCVGCDLADSQQAVDFVQSRENCWATIGIHPHEAQQYVADDEKLVEFAALATQSKVVAVGECGLDYYYNHSPKEAQLTLLKFQIELALKHDLPLIFHVREAFDDFWPIFEQYQGIRGVLHSFTDNQANLDKALAHGLSIGVNGIATFAKNPDQLAIYKAIPLQNLLLETDAPFLTPAPYRGSINEPKYVAVVAQFLADVRGENLENLTAQTTTNAHTLFGI